MELGPILRSLLFNKGRFWLITIEIALTLAVVTNCTMLMLGQYREMMRPSGMDERNILVVRSEVISQDLKEKEALEAQIVEDLRLLRGQQGVRSATVMSAIPLSGGGSASGRKAAGSELDTLTAPYFIVRGDAVKTLGVEIAEGRDFVEADFPEPEEKEDDETAATGEGKEPEIERNNVIVSKHFADKLYPDGDALGKEIQNKTDTEIDTIVGIVGKMQCSWPSSTVAEDVVLFPGKPGNARRVYYFVRAEPAAVADLYKDIEENLVASHEGRLVEVQTLKEIKDNTFSDNPALIKMIGGVVVLLFTVTSLGIVGLTSFSVTQRFRQIGTRRALGATRLAILRYFLVENWVITGIGLAIGLGLSYGLNQLLVAVADAPKLEWGLLGASLILFWLVGLAAALAPAMRGMRVSPVIATRTV